MTQYAQKKNIVRNAANFEVFIVLHYLILVIQKFTSDIVKRLFKQKTQLKCDVMKIKYANENYQHMLKLLRLKRKLHRRDLRCELRTSQIRTKCATTVLYPILLYFNFL